MATQNYHLDWIKLNIMCINLILIGAISYALFDIITFFRNIKDTITCIGT